MLSQIMENRRVLPSWGTLIMAFVASLVLIQLPHPHNETQGLTSHLLAVGAVLIVWSRLQCVNELQEWLLRLKYGVVAGLSEAIILAGAGTVYQAETASLSYAFPLGWLCATTVLVDHGIRSHAPDSVEPNWLLQRLSIGRCLLLLLGIGGHLLSQTFGIAVFSMGMALTLILALSVLGCVRRYLLVARSLRPPSKVEVRPGLEVQP